MQSSFRKNLPLFALLIMGTGLAIAADSSDGRAFSYTGYLEEDAAAVNTPRAMRFQLYTDATDAAICQTVEQGSVELNAGTFSVVLEDIVDNCLKEGALYMDIGIAPEADTNYVTLGGRVRITSTPFALGVGGFSNTGGFVVGKNDILFTDPENGDATMVLTGSDDAYPEDPVALRTLSNPENGDALFRVLSSGGGERLRVEHGGELFTDGAMRSTGSIAAGTSLSAGTSLTVTTLADVGSLAVQGSSTFAGDLDVDANALVFKDALNGNTDIELTANDALYDEKGLSVRALTNPDDGDPLFRVLS